MCAIFTGCSASCTAISAAPLTNQRDIIEELWPRFANTLFLAGYAALIAVPLAVGLGILSAIREGRFTDRLANILTLIAISVPEFFVGYILIIIFAIELGWFPSLATVFPGMGIGERFYVATLPALTLTMVVMAHMLRMTRNSVLSIMSTPYIEMAFLKGLTRSRVVSRHALPNAAGPIISVVALNLAYLVVGVVVVENVFVYPGVGQYMVDAVSKRDVPVDPGLRPGVRGRVRHAEHVRRHSRHPRQSPPSTSTVEGTP